MSCSRPKTPAAIAWWLGFCAFCNCAGWILSACRQLNPWGYAVTSVATAATLFALRKRICPVIGFPSARRSVGRRFGRLFPFSFLVLTALAAVGGALYAPSNYDALAYRVPRVWHWLAEGRYHWIHTEFGRLNTRAPGFEWVATPLMAFTHADRLLFLINVVSLLLLPGLVFSLFTRLGVRSRVAWYWMWLVPTGYCFLLQAGSIGNDLFGAVFALAALDFALRARESGRVSDVWLSALAAALLTSSKASDLPLLLPWLVAIGPSLKLLWRGRAITAGVAAIALACSLLPQMAVNAKYCGSWTGAPAENIELKPEPALHTANNAVLLTIQNLVPPVFPLSSAWNRAMERLMPAAWRTKLETAFEPIGAHWELNEMQMEEHAGLGCGVSFLALVSIAAMLFGKRTRSASAANGGAKLFPVLVLGCVVVALLAFMSVGGQAAVARLATPYYAVVLPLALLSSSQVALVRNRWWQRAAWLVFPLALLPLILSPARPLWPANTVIAKCDSSSRLMARAKTVYSVYAQRANGFAPALALLPPGTPVLGVVVSDDPEASLWRPFGARRIEHVMRGDTPAALRARGVLYILACPERVQVVLQQPFEQWLAEMNGEIVAKVTLSLRAGAGPSEWCLIRLRLPDNR